MSRYGEVWLVFLCVWLVLAGLGDQAAPPALRVALIVGSFLAAAFYTLGTGIHHRR